MRSNLADTLLEKGPHTKVVSGIHGRRKLSSEIKRTNCKAAIKLYVDTTFTVNVALF